MAIGMIGKKIGMTRVFLKDGTSVPATIIQLKPNCITSIKTMERDGYTAIQVGALEDKEKHLTKPELGHLKKVGRILRKLREFRVDSVEGFEVGQVLRVENVFQPGELVDVLGRSKGRGFAGTMKRWDFGGFPKSHGHRYHRAVGSIGNRSDPGRVWKSKRMAGHWGNEPIKVQALLVLDIIPEYDVMLVKGSVPGPEGGLIYIEKSRIADRRSQRLKLARMKPVFENLLKEVGKDESA
ncbi:MAG: 50S ribosomal protein L3 [Aquificaceae bacterium]|nr:50S ribosomal protein L3 [Aquificaceae bacterium]MCX8164805.1 50S ribosomal protein L3 [Aquificaceae bacterium]